MAKFSKAVYNEVARVLSSHDMPEGVRAALVASFANRFDADNAAFDRGRFVSACQCVTEEADKLTNAERIALMKRLVKLGARNLASMTVQDMLKAEAELTA